MNSRPDEATESRSSHGRPWVCVRADIITDAMARQAPWVCSEEASECASACMPILSHTMYL